MEYEEKTNKGEQCRRRVRLSQLLFVLLKPEPDSDIIYIDPVSL